MRALVDFFIKRHFLVHVMVAVVVVVGLTKAMSSQREGFPAITLNQLIVTATLPGASAADVETKVTIPLEDAIEDVDGVDEFHSVVTDNVSVTTVEIYDDWSPQQVREVQSDLRQAIDGVRDFPDDMEDTPTVTRVEPAKMPVLEIALEGPSDAVEVAAERLERRIERVDGIASVSLVGVEDPEMQILLDPAAARTHGVDLNDIIAAVDRRNVSGTGGILESDADRKQVVMNARFATPAEVAATPLQVNPDGGVLTVGDVARVHLTTEDSGLRVHTNGKPGVSVVIRKKTDADIIAAVDAIKAAAEEVELPDGVEATFVGDQSFIVRNRLGVMASNGVVGIVLVVLVLGIFLTRKAALWVGVGVPVVLLGVIVLMPMVGITLNLIALGGLVMVLGLLVDDAVVVAERIVAKQNEGTSDTPEVDGVMSVAKPVIASAITTSLAFTPMLAIGGMPGKVAWALPVVVMLALALSLIESFLILPAHMHEAPEARARKKQATPKRKFVIVLEKLYERALRVALKGRYLVLGGFIALFAFVMAVLGPRMGFDLFPQDDAEALYIKVNMPLGTPIEQTEAVATSLERQLPQIMGDDLMAVTARVGHQSGAAVDQTTGSAENEAVISALLEPQGRQYNAGEWAVLLTDSLHVPENAQLVFETKRVGPPVGGAVTLHIASNDDELRRSTAEQARAWLADIEGIVDVEIDERPGIRQIELSPDPEKLAMRGLDASVVSLTLKAAFHGLTVSEHRTLEDTTRFRVMFDPTARVDLDALLDTPIRARNGTLVSLRDVVSPVEVAAVSRIYHRDGVRAATVTANIAPGASLDASKMAKRVDAELLPALANPAVDAYQGGEATETAKTQKDMGQAGALAVFGMVVVVAVMLNSFVDAFFVVSVIPFGVAGVVTTFYLHGKSLSMFAVLGIIGLAGVVVNASIVMLDAAKQKQAEAQPDPASQRSAIISAVVERMRPILVTTLTTVGGVMPTAYGLGGYDAVLSPMSLALGWGLIFATSITLFLVPSLFAIAEDIRALLKRGRGATVPADVTQPTGR
ncbi:MAG: efflux RND transporter permease subunit [Myxococcota bacterium]